MPIDYEKKDKIAYITINGRNEVNPFSPEMYEELYHVFKDFRDDRKLSVAIITGEGSKAFSVGGDLKRMVKSADELDHLEIFERIWYPHTEPLGYPSLLHDVFNMQMWKPIVAAVNGYCLAAGLEILLLMTDIRVASEDAKFGLRRGFARAGRRSEHWSYDADSPLYRHGAVADRGDDGRPGCLAVGPGEQSRSQGPSVARGRGVRSEAEQHPAPSPASAEGDGRCHRRCAAKHGPQYARILGAMQRVVPDAYEGQISFLERRDPDYKG